MTEPSMRTFTVWLDSGANIHSKNEMTVTLDDFGLTGHEWDHLSESEKEDLMREVIFDKADWGWEEIL